MRYLVLVPDMLNQAGLAALRSVAAFEVHAPGKMTREQTLARIPDAHALIVRSDTRVDAALLEHANRLRVVVRAGVGVDNIDLEACTARGIVVMNTPEANTVSTAEHTLALMLALARHIPQADRSLREGRWERSKFVGTQLAGKTLGIIGYGRVGHAVAERAKALGMAALAYDPFVPERLARRMAMLADLGQVLAQADVLSLHAVVTDETREMINRETLARMKDGVLIVNTARGALIHSADLAEALRSGKVAGAAVDVYDPEPPAPDHPLIGLPNVIHTPHLGASTHEAQSQVGVEAADAVRKALLEGRYDNVRNREVLGMG